jgi:hypothetical protein
MEQNNQEPRPVEQLAKVADILQNMYKNRGVVVFELDRYDFDQALRSFDNVDLRSDKFKIDISGTEFIYLLREE